MAESFFLLFPTWFWFYTLCCVLIATHILTVFKSKLLHLCNKRFDPVLKHFRISENIIFYSWKYLQSENEEVSHSETFVVIENELFQIIHESDICGRENVAAVHVGSNEKQTTCLDPIILLLLSDSKDFSWTVMETRDDISSLQNVTSVLLRSAK